MEAKDTKTLWGLTNSKPSRGFFSLGGRKRKVQWSAPSQRRESRGLLTTNLSTRQPLYLLPFSSKTRA